MDESIKHYRDSFKSLLQKYIAGSVAHKQQVLHNFNDVHCFDRQITKFPSIFVMFVRNE